MNFTIYGDPKTKKNSQQIFRSINGRPFITQSEAYKRYSKEFCSQVDESVRQRIKEPVNVKCVYYRQTTRKVDLVNLLNATNDLLVDCGVLEDDNCKIVASHDGSRVCYDKENPRVEIEIEEMK